MVQWLGRRVCMGLDPGSNPVLTNLRGPFLESPETLRAIFGMRSRFPMYLSVS